MNTAGQVRLLSSEQMQQVHDKACELLEKKGIVFDCETAIETFVQHGFKIDGKTVYFKKAIVEKCLEQTPKKFKLEGYDPTYNVTVGEGLLIHPSGGEIHILDYDGKHGHRRNPVLEDFANLQKLYQRCDNVDIAGYQPISPSDVPNRTKGLHCMLESFRHSTKPLLSPMELDTVDQKLETLELFELVYGKGHLEDHYLTWHAVCPNSPYIYSVFACEGIRIFAEANQPVLIVSAPMSGITAPVYLLSTLILSIAEELAGLVYAQLVRPGVPVIFSASLTYGYMKSATWECASPDTTLMLGASIQMMREFYGLPARAQTGVTSSKTNDFQAGMETMQSLLHSALAGVNLTSQSVGSLANLLTISLEKTVLDDEIIGRVRHIVAGMEFSEEQMGLEELMLAEPGADFLTEDSTVEHFRDYWDPIVSDWGNIVEWEAEGSLDVVDRAHDKVIAILDEAPQSHLEPDLEADLVAYINKIEKNA